MTFLSRHYLPWVIGFAYSVVVGHYAIKFAARQMWNAVGLGELQRDRRSWQTQAVGMTERALYTASILTGHPEFVAVWLGLKTVTVVWSVWGNTPAETAKRTGVFAREIYNNFLLGTALSIGFGAVGAYTTELLTERRGTPALLVDVAVLLGTVALSLWIRSRGKKYQREHPGSAGDETSSGTTR